LSAGPRIDFLTSAKWDGDGDEITGNNTINIGMILGGGIKSNFGRFQLGIRGDYFLNFNSIYNSDHVDVNDRTFNLSFFVGYRI
jgi:hypothetical protein